MDFPFSKGVAATALTGIAALVIACSGKKEEKIPYAGKSMKEIEAISQEKRDVVLFDRTNVPATYADMRLAKYQIPTDIKVIGIRWRADEEYDQFKENDGWRLTGRFDYCVDPLVLCERQNCQVYTGDDGKPTHIITYNKGIEKTSLVDEPFRMDSPHCDVRKGSIWLRDKEPEDD